MWYRNSPNSQGWRLWYLTPLSTIFQFHCLSTSCTLTCNKMNWRFVVKCWINCVFCLFVSLYIFIRLFVCLFLIFNAFTIASSDSREEHPGIKIYNSICGERRYSLPYTCTCTNTHASNNARKTRCELFSRRMLNQTLIERKEPSSNS